MDNDLAVKVTLTVDILLTREEYDDWMELRVARDFSDDMTYRSLGNRASDIFIIKENAQGWEE